MAVVIAPYCTSTFNSLPNFEDAGPRFDAVDGKTLIANIMTPLFRKHGVENILGLQLLHQHFQLNSGERLVDFNGTSVPIVPEGDQISNMTPTIWGLKCSGNQFQLHPLEFMLNSGHTDQDEASPWNDVNFSKFITSKQPFFLEYSAEVKKLRLEGLFGFARYPGDGFPGRVEVGVGRTNINLSPAQGMIYAKGKARDATWVFTEDFTKRGCRCVCPEYNGVHDGHNRHVITQSG